MHQLLCLIQLRNVWCLCFHLFITIPDFSRWAKISYLTQTRTTITFSYNCRTILEATDQQYEVACNPSYDTNQAFFAPRNQDAATILCKANNLQITDTLVGGNTWAIPCNNNPECDDRSDEFECEFPTWLIPSLLCGAGAVLCVTLFVYLYKSIKSEWKKKMKYRNSRFSIQRSHLSIESEKLYKTAVMIEKEDTDKIHKMYCQELENNGGEGGAICYFKVIQ